MKYSNVASTLIRLGACFFLLYLTASWVSANTLYVSPKGVDSNDGLKQSAALKTIGKALDIAYGGDYSANQTITIKVLDGVYNGQSKRVRLAAAVPSVNIIGEMKGSKRPIFSDGKKNQTWLTVYADQGQELKLTIANIELRKYFSAISIVGDRDNSSQGSHGLVLKNNIFRAIGSQPNNSSKDRISTGAIRLINSSDSLIVNNKFLSIRNSTGCSALHAIYLAHFSSNNTIRQNVFDDTCGAPIRLRDHANNNRVVNNTFTNLEEVSAVQEWFCDKGARRGCTKQLGECPSINNTAENNNYPQNRGRDQNIQIVGKTTPRSWCPPEQFKAPRINVR